MAIDVSYFQSQIDDAKAFISSIPEVNHVKDCLQNMASELRHKPRCGPTFAECVVIIALLSIMLALAVGVLSGSMRSAREMAERNRASANLGLDTTTPPEYNDKRHRQGR